MLQKREPAIVRLVAHHNGPVALSALLGGVPVYQEIQRWLKRGWASPMHIFRLEPHLPPGMDLRDLNRDREIASPKRTPATEKAAANG